MVNGDANRGTNGILTTVAFADAVLLVVLYVVVELEEVLNFARLVRETVFLDERHDARLDRSEGGRKREHDTAVATFERLLLVGGAHDRKEHTVNADGSLDDIRGVALLGFRVEIFNLLATELGVLSEVEVGAAVDAFDFLESEWHFKLNVGSGVGVVSQLVVVVESIFVVTETKSLVPTETNLLPLGEPVEFCSRLNEELHLHLFKLAHAEHELARYNLVAECLANLRDAERQLHASALLHVEVVDKDALRRFRTEVDFACGVGSTAHFG